VEGWLIERGTHILFLKGHISAYYADRNDRIILWKEEKKWTENRIKTIREMKALQWTFSYSILGWINGRLGPVGD
jgi:hypothetical protein